MAVAADYFMRVLQLGPEDEDENGKKGSDLPALWREQGQVRIGAVGCAGTGPLLLCVS